MRKFNQDYVSTSKNYGLKYVDDRCGICDYCTNNEVDPSDHFSMAPFQHAKATNRVFLDPMTGTPICNRCWTEIKSMNRELEHRDDYLNGVSDEESVVTDEEIQGWLQEQVD